jgi:Tfp pilus assembly protein PilX
MQRHKHKTGGERGIALIGALCFTVVVLGLGMAVTGMATFEQKSARQAADVIVSRNVAEAGADLAMWQLKQDSTFRCSGSPAGFTNAPLSTTVAGQTVTLGNFTVSPITTNADGTVALSTSGLANGLTSGTTGKLKRIGITAYQTAGGSAPFGQAAFAKNTITLSGSAHTDSYKSSIGAYGGTNANGNNGGLGTNSSASTAISAPGNPTVKGALVGGVGCDPVAIKNLWHPGWGSPNYPTGGFLAATAATTLPDVALPTNGVSFATVQVLKRNTSTGALYLAANGTTALTPARGFDAWSGNYTWNIPTGVYNLTKIDLSSDQNIININGDVTLVVNGPVTTGGNTTINVSATGSLQIYTAGNVSIGASFTNLNANPNLPAKCQILCTPACSTVTWSGYNDFVGVVYAPSSTVNLTASSNLYGSVVGNNITISGNSAIHYDECLGAITFGGGAGAFRTRSWEEDG